MAGEGYADANGIFGASQTSGGVGVTASSDTSPSYGIAYIGQTGGGAGATAGNCIYSVAAVYGTLIISEFVVALGVIPTAVSPILKFWRRPDATLVNAPGAGSDAAMTPATLTIPYDTNPVPITGNVYIIRFTAGNTFEPGEAFVVEIDTIDTGADATCVCGAAGYYYRFSFDGKDTSAGVAKANSDSIGRVYVVTS